MVCEVCLGWRGGSSYGEGGRRMRSCCPTTSQILRPPGFGFGLSRLRIYIATSLGGVLSLWQHDKGRLISDKPIFKVYRVLAGGLSFFCSRKFLNMEIPSVFGLINRIKFEK